jgi:hypothetical protein
MHLEPRNQAVLACEPEKVMATFGGYILLGLILSAPFAPLVARVVADYLNERSKTRWTEKVT